jgi:hypothetical protein
MIKITDNFLDDKHYEELTSLHIEYGKVHWFGESCSPTNSLQKLIFSTHYSKDLSGATAWYNIRPLKPQWHNDIKSYCTQNTIEHFPKKLPKYTFLYYVKTPDIGGELELETGDLITPVINRLVRIPCDMTHRVRPYAGNRVSIGIIWWYDVSHIYGDLPRNKSQVLERVWEIEDAEKAIKG